MFLFEWSWTLKIWNIPYVICRQIYVIKLLLDYFMFKYLHCTEAVQRSRIVNGHPCLCHPEVTTQWRINLIKNRNLRELVMTSTSHVNMDLTDVMIDHYIQGCFIYILYFIWWYDSISMMKTLFVNQFECGLQLTCQ